MLLNKLRVLRRRSQIAAVRLWQHAAVRQRSLAVPLENPRALLVQNISGIGNALMATPLLAELRRLYPEAQIDFLTTPAAAALLAGNPHASRIIPDASVGKKGRREWWRVVRFLREARYDATFVTLTAIDFEYVVRVPLAAIRTAAIHQYELHAYNDFTCLFSHRVPFDQTRHDVESNLDLLRALTTETVQAGRLVLTLPQEALKAARDALGATGMSGAGQAVVFCPGSTARWSHKRWPRESYLQLIGNLLANHINLHILVLCGPDEMDDAEYFKAELRDRRAAVLSGLPLLTYAGILDSATVVVSGDSLPVHVRAAFQKPLVALFGPTDPRRTGPWQCLSTVLTPKCDYIPYYRVPYPPDPATFPPCMPLLPVEEVEAAVEGYLAQRS
ncbi:MAG: glycosyltransferase family 9 protein [Candidatus Hydrogenedentes bacterium]|nr:glycosyltransferase family 9 protein [Candidatus Hydrogenedentota bacterium]